MTPKHWFAIGAFASAAFAVSAQPAPAAPDPLDSSAAVPAASYRSAFDTYQRTAGEQPPSPDKVWRTANDQIAGAAAHGEHQTPQADAHAGHAMPQADAHAGHAMPQAAAHAGHATPSAAAAPAAPKTPPADHSKHH